jgi:hypothetical protein
MHTDEFEISLSRELAVCRTAIAKIERFLTDMTRKYNIETGTFLQHYRKGALPRSKDFVAWAENHEALNKWQASLEQYEDLFRSMKI